MFGLSHFKSTRRRIGLLAERVEWTTWIEDNFQWHKFFWTREALWKEMHSLLAERSSWTVHEFGVAWGFATHYWTSRVKQEIPEWHGFDRFTGLPRDWCDLKEQAFDAGGIPPAITDPRITRHVGDVE